MRHTVQIIGNGPCDPVPVLVPGIEKWALNALAFKPKIADRLIGWTRWFDLHHVDHIQKVRPEAYEWFKEQDKLIYLWEVDPNIPASVAYPLPAIQSYFNVNGKPERHFQSSFDYLIALALYEDFEQIDVYGFQMLSPRYTFQLHSALYWVGRARGLGVSVIVHGESALNPVNKLYGYETVNITEFWDQTDRIKPVELAHAN